MKLLRILSIALVAALLATLGYVSHAQILSFTFSWPAIVSLFFGCSPPAIRWLVISIIIYTFKCEFRRSLSHISEKIDKYFPPFANFNTSSTIIWPFFSFGIFTTKAHRVPNSILGCLFSRSSTAMPEIAWPFFTYIFQKTSTAFCVARSEACTDYHDCVSALAFTFPKSLTGASYASK